MLRSNLVFLLFAFARFFGSFRLMKWQQSQTQSIVSRGKAFLIYSIPSGGVNRTMEEPFSPLTNRRRKRKLWQTQVPQLMPKKWNPINWKMGERRASEKKSCERTVKSFYFLPNKQIKNLIEFSSEIYAIASVGRGGEKEIWKLGELYQLSRIAFFCSEKIRSQLEAFNWK